MFVRGKVEARTDVMEACSRAEGVSSEKMQAYAVSADSETESSWFDWKGSRVFGRSGKVGRKYVLPSAELLRDFALHNFGEDDAARDRALDRILTDSACRELEMSTASKQN